MMNKSQKQIIIPSIAVMILLLIAILPIKEYGYYILLRWVVFLTATYICYFSYQAERMNWVWLMGFVAIVFNPIIPLHMNKEFWQVIDFVTAVIFIGFVIFMRKEKRSGKGGDMKKCPYCAEEIQDNAVKCRFCGEWLEEKEELSPLVKTELQKPIERRILATKWLWFWTFIKLPISFSTLIIMGTVLLFSGSDAIVFSLSLLSPGILYLVAWIGFVKKKKWGWIINWIIIFGEPAFYIYVSAVTPNKSVVYYVNSSLVIIVWISLNFIYFWKRRILFS